MLREALGNVFVEWYAEKFGEASGNERGEVALLVATLGRGNDAPVAGSERMTENLPYKGIHTLGKLLDHIGVALNVGQRPAIERLFPKRDNPELGIAVLDTDFVRSEVASSFIRLLLFPCRTLLLGKEVFAE